MNLKREKIDSIVGNFINGNLSDFRKQIKRLSKSELIELCIEYIYSYSLEREKILDFLCRVNKNLIIK